MAYEVKNHRLELDGKAIDFAQSPHGGAALKPLYLIMHYTAGTTASGAINWFKNPDAKASAHLVIDRDGTATQMMAFNKVTWHAGKSSWNDIVGLNSHSIGIEIVNAGKLKQTADGKWLNWANNVIKPAEVIVAKHKDESEQAGWHVYTKEQIQVVGDIGVALQKAYGFLDVLGHEDISPKRKVDPGPAFPMLSIRSKILGRIDG